jgi:3-oxosteroid 1-dehydrogenase
MEMRMNRGEDFDVVVIGSGIAGVSAALAAHEMGLRPVLLEKSDLLGGGTTYSYGLIWAPRSHLARAAGVSDCREDIVRYMRFMGAGYETDDRMFAYIDRGPEAIEFYTRCGIRLRLSKSVKDMYVGKVPSASSGGRSLEHDLISGFELGDWRERVLVPPVTPHTVLVEEMIAWGGIHNEAAWDHAVIEERTRKDIRGLGYGLISGFVKELVSRGIAIRTSAAVDRLVLDADRVTGVLLADGTSIRARHGVVIAAGGYESNDAMVKNYEGLPEWCSMFPDTLTGDGIVMAAEHGATVYTIHHTFRLHVGIKVPGGARNGAAAFRDASIIELTSPHTLVVNRSGRRFGNEAFFQDMAEKLRNFDGPSHCYQNLPCFLIFDRQYSDRYSFAGIPAGDPIPEWVTRADTISRLGAMLGVDAEQLSRTVARFNQLATNGADEDFGRGSEEWRLAGDAKGGTNPRLGVIDKPPFYGVKLHPSSPASAGLETDAHGRVLHQRRHPIPGLYASGNVAAHTEFGIGYQAGLSIASGMIFSYLAVRQMLAQGSQAAA